MARKDQLSEEIRLLTEMLKLLWLTLIALIGSVSGLALAEFGLRIVAIGAGVIATVTVVGLIGYLYRRLLARVANMEEV